MAPLHALVEEVGTITISTTGVDCNDEDDNKDDDAITSLLVFEPQDFSQPPSNKIAIFGADDKERAGCSQDVAIYATGHQYIHKILVERQAKSTSEHNFNT